MYLLPLSSYTATPSYWDEGSTNVCSFEPTWIWNSLLLVSQYWIHWLHVSCTLCIHKALSNVIHWVNVSTCAAYVNTKQTQDIKYSICQQQRVFWWGQIECNLCRSSCTIRDIFCVPSTTSPHTLLFWNNSYHHTAKRIYVDGCGPSKFKHISGAL